VPLGTITSTFLTPVCCPWLTAAGHGGPNAADYVRSNLFINLLEHTKFTTDIASALGEPIQELHMLSGAPCRLDCLTAYGLAAAALHAVLGRCVKRVCIPDMQGISA
jgi:hypothetical protein